MTMKREPGIDFWKGIAAVSIINIHTVWWSGMLYVPEWYRSLSLLFDVPLFMFLAGWGASFSRKIDLGRSLIRVGKTMVNYILIMLALHLVECLITGSQTTGLQLLREMTLMDYPALPSFPVFSYQLWFMQMWIPVTILGHVVLWLRDRIPGEKAGWWMMDAIIIILLAGIIFFSVGWGASRIGMDRTICFYLFFFFLGYQSKGLSFRSLKASFISLLIIAVTYILVLKLTGVWTLSLQELKFPPHILYAIVSLASATLVLCGKNRMEKWMSRCRGIRYIGRNALSFYFSQGIGSSLLIGIAPEIRKLGLPWVGTYLICLLINLMLSITGGLVLAKCYQYFWLACARITSRIKKQG